MYQRSTYDLETITTLPPRGEHHIARLIEELGENPAREGLQRTPHRVWESLSHLTDGYGQDLGDVIGDAIFEESYDEMVVVRDVEFYSLCEHHMLPFFGVAHIAYIPDGRIVGLSKLPRAVDVFSHRRQVQERLTTPIADGLEDALPPKAIAAVKEAAHLCSMRLGVATQRSTTVTSATRGIV